MSTDYSISGFIFAGNGAALARDVHRTAAVLGAMVAAVRVPATAKMRIGWDHSSINAPELSRALQDVGVAAVTVHGRTRRQAYQGWADWREIARVRSLERRRVRKGYTAPTTRRGLTLHYTPPSTVMVASTRSR